MKKKNICLSILSFLLIFCCSLGTVKTIQDYDYPKIDESDMSWQLIYDVNRFSKTLLYDATKTDEEGEKPYLNFADPEIVQEYQSSISDLRRDPNIKYQMTINGEILRSNLESTKPVDGWLWEMELSYDEKGNCTSKSSDELNFCEYIEFYYYYPGYSALGGYEPTVKQENPTNVTFFFALPKEMKQTGMFYERVAFEYNTQRDELVGVILCIVAFILFIYMMVMPYRLIAETWPFKIIKEYKLLVHALVLGCSLPILMVTSVEVARLITEEISISTILMAITPPMIVAGGILFFMIFYSWMLWAFFMIKVILKTGIVKYLKNYTYIGSIIRSIKALFHEYATFDLNDDLNKKIFKFVVLNMLVLFFVVLIPGINLIFVVIYSGCFYHFIRKKITVLQSDYEKLLRKTQRVAQGDFTKNESSNYGYFQSLGDEFENIQEGFENAVNEEVKSSKVKTELISNVSHDLKTPLTSIITYVDLLKKEDLTEEERNNYLAILDRNSLRLKHLIDDLFEVSKVNSGDVKLNLVEVDLVSLMNQTIFENEDQLANKQLEVRFTKNKEKMMMICDSLKTYRIFENLLNNIAKYALANTRVYLSLEEKEDEIIATFKNISETEMNFDTEEITDRFVRGDKSRNSEGSGLGLAIVKSFAEIQNAKFEIETDGDLFKAKVIFKKDCK